MGKRNNQEAGTPDSTPNAPATGPELLPVHGPAIPDSTPVDASGRPMVYAYHPNVYTDATGHKATVPGGPGTGTPADAPSRCYGCNNAWRSNSQPVVAADGMVWHNVCAMPKWYGPGLPKVAVTRTAPVVSNPARAQQQAELDAMRAQMAAMAEQMAAVTAALLAGQEAGQKAS